MCLVVVFVEQVVKGVFYCVGCGGEDVCFYGWQVDDVFVNEVLWDLKVFGIDFVEVQEFFGQVVDSVVYVDLGFGFFVWFGIQVYVVQFVGFDYVDLFVLFFFKVGVDYNCVVVVSVDQIWIVVVLFYGLDDVFELLGCGGVVGIEEML